MKPWKVRKVFEDIVYDLRSRGLLPVVILLVVAMVAVPILISRGSSGSAATSLQASASSATPAPETEAAVVSYSPGVRNYKQRLDDLSAKDPFRQQGPTGASVAAASALSTSAPTSGSASGSSSTTATTVSGGSDGSADTGTRKQPKSSKTTNTYSVNVLAGDVKVTLTPFKDVQAMTPLPSQSTPVVLFYGLTSDHKKARFLVSNKVASVSGPGICVPSPDDCALLTLRAGQSEDLVSTADGKTYRVVVAEIKSVKK
jgi:hypothetical protein